MSYTIEYNRMVFKKKLDEIDYYFLLIRQGSNNTTDENGLRERHWYVAYVGEYKGLWKYVCNRASSTIGGGVQKCKGSNSAEYFVLENYIKMYRSKIKNAKDFEKLFESFSITSVISIKTELLAKELEGKVRTLQNIVELYSYENRGSNWYDKEKTNFHHRLRVEEMNRTLLKELNTTYRNEFTVSYDIYDNRIKKSRRKTHW